MNKSLKRIGIAFVLLVFAIPIVIAQPSEYIFQDELLNGPISEIVIGKEVYQVYSINKSKMGTLLVIDKNGDLPIEVTSKQAMFAYFTYEYISQGQEGIKKEYHSISNMLKGQAKSFSQSILNVFKLLKESCFTPPRLEFIQICVKPNDKLHVTKFVWLLVVDWDTAVGEYESLGGKLLYFMDNSDMTIDYDSAVELHKSLYSMYAFSEVATKQSGINFIPGDVLNPNSLLNSIGNSVDKEYMLIDSRIKSLREDEESKFNNAASRLVNLHLLLKEITKMGGDVGSFSEKRKLLSNQLDSISLKDKKLSSDIRAIDSILVEITTLENNVERTHSETQESYNAKNKISQWWTEFLGWFKSYSV